MGAGQRVLPGIKGWIVAVDDEAAVGARRQDELVVRLCQRPEQGIDEVHAVGTDAGDAQPEVDLAA